MVKRKKAAVSACLLGEFCRYDGTTKASAGVIEALKDWEIVPFCPEAPVLGTPRGRISVVEMPEGLRLLRDEDGEDVTDAILKETEKLIAAHPDLAMIVLKSKSPSCGTRTTPILDETREPLRLGDGMASQRLRDAFPDIDIFDEYIFETETRAIKE